MDLLFLSLTFVLILLGSTPILTKYIIHYLYFRQSITLSQNAAKNPQLIEESYKLSAKHQQFTKSRTMCNRKGEKFLKSFNSE